MDPVLFNFILGCAIAASNFDIDYETIEVEKIGSDVWVRFLGADGYTAGPPHSFNEAMEAIKK